MKRLLNTLFVRLALMTVGLICLLHATSMVLIERDRGELDVLHIAHAVMTVAAVHEEDPALMPTVAANLGLVYVPDIKLAAGHTGHTSGFFPAEEALREHLPAGSSVRVATSGDIFVNVSGTAFTIVVPQALLPASRYLSATFLMLAFGVIAALVFSWYLQQPIRRLADASRLFRNQGRSVALPLRGPTEIRDLTEDFNQTVTTLSELEKERAVMLGGLAHDLRAPITRIQVRADQIESRKDRNAFLRDTEAMSRIVDQFLDFARGTFEPSPLVSVDTFCQREYGGVNDEARTMGDVEPDLMRLDLCAGAGFRLPLNVVERSLSNLVENAFIHGSPPIEITTRRERGRFILRVSDQGEGVSQDDMASMLLPFVRLDPARGGHARCGLGLSIVKRLATSAGGSMNLSNAPGGGLVVTMSFHTDETLRADVRPRAASANV
ncbi:MULTISPECIES: ATP-binding protein [unclassified Paraburkholderia]|uniref:ATP-binding protein n=1 Tax=unclassified Paraburkholderia TaxID=2615204 RepID=UPI002AB0DA5A|nr:MULTISPECIES: ATP-binding protein [unclassified Paraburkholderia]